MTSGTAPTSPSSPTEDVGQRILGWLRREPLGAVLWIAIAGVLVYFFGYYRVFMNGSESTAQWAWLGWNQENDQEHCVFIVPIMLFLLWNKREEMRTAVKAPSARGLAFVVAGVLLFVMAARCIQARIAILSAPLIIYGAAEYLGGRAFARSFIFPCLLMLFMVPIGGVIQGTVSLQLIASKTVGAICGLLGIHVQIVGTQIIVDGHSFEVAGGCSGIRSLMAMTMLAALYVHFVIQGAWQQFTVFAGSVLFALIGNIGRLFTVVLVAKWWSPVIAGGLYHDYSGFIFFPCAVLAMVGFGNLINRDWATTRAEIAKKLTAPDHDARIVPAAEAEAAPMPGERKPTSPISYDY